MLDGRLVSDSAIAYHTKKALSKSSMDELLKCPAKFKYALEHMGEETESSTFLTGSLFHTMVLEPEKTSLGYRKKAFSGATKAGKEAATKAAADGVSLVPAGTWELCENMAAVANSHQLIVAAKQAADWSAETSIYWEERGHIPCKARVDALATIFGQLTAIDLKSTTDSSLDGISRHIAEYGYHRQAAWYMHALRKAGRDVRSFIFLFVEKTPPHIATAVAINEAAIGVATDEIKHALDLYEECAASGNWPGYPTSGLIEIVDLPTWYYRKIEG